MSRSDYYASPFGVAFSAYMERPRLSRLIARTFWGSDIRPYYESMAAVAEAPRGGTVVDCPCGAGPALRGLAPGQSVRYLAVDLSPSMLRRARRRAEARSLSRVELVEADATKVPLPDDSADLFLSYWGLHCFDDPAAALREAGRILKPGGRLVGSTFVLGGSRRRGRLLVKPGRGDFGRPGSGDDVMRWLGEAGFAQPDIRSSGSMLYFDARLRRASGPTRPPSRAPSR
ncbi:MAG TPA: class I SAM-dependent methyltransferase [Solirubrobacterales bacterium]|nr:class I SAM-dependent methyltransferase [Solirubrobacterales bacterium]